MEQARLADAWFRDHGDKLAVPLPGPLGAVAQCVHFASAPYELGQTAPNCSLKPRAQRSQAGHFMHFDRFLNSPQSCRAQRLERKVALAPAAGRITDCD